MLERVAALRVQPHPLADLPIARTTVPASRAQRPRRIERGARVGCFPVARGLPRISGGSASAISLSRPAQASLTLRPVRLLNRPKAAFVARLQPKGLPPKPLASYQIKPTTIWVESSTIGDPRRR